MGKILKKGKVVIMLSGRYAGKKAVIVKTFDDGQAGRKFPFALVAGVARYPRKVTRSMSEKKIAKRSKIKPFVKAVNFTHVMPTRYQTDMDLKETVTIGDLNDAGKRQDMRKAVKKIFEAKYLNQTVEKKDKKAIGAAFLFDKMQF
eukprot:g284.t1